MKNPNTKTKVVHSASGSEWKIVGVKLGGKHDIARVPYLVVADLSVRQQNASEAFDHAEFISYCFNNSEMICSLKVLGTSTNTKR